MNIFNRMKSSTAVIAALATGMVLLAGDANAKDGGGSNSRQDQGRAANVTPANSAGKTAPISTCWACRFVKRDGTDKLERKSVSGGDKSGHDMSGHDKSARGDKHDKDHDREHLDDGKHKMPKPGAKPVETTGGMPAGKPVETRGGKPAQPGPKPVETTGGMPAQPGGKPVETSGGKPTQSGANNSGTPPAAKPVPVATPAPGTGGTTTIHPIVTPPPAVTISNGVTKLNLAELPGGLLVKSNEAGQITVSNGKDSVTLQGGSVTVSGAISVGAAAGLQMVRHPNGDVTVAAASPPPAPAPAPPTPDPGHVTGGPAGGSYFGALGSGIWDGIKFFGPDGGIVPSFEAHPVQK
jgi:hypothetical protein